jgi:hypothetical protein
MAQQHLVTSYEFLAMTDMDVSQFYILFIDGKLPIVERQDYKYIDVGDVRARQWLPDYRPEKDLFA